MSIAKEITLPDKFENMGAEIVKEVANKTNDIAGDGTTTAVVLTQAIIEEGLKQTNKGVNAMGIRLGIEAAAKAVVEALRASAKEIKKSDEIKTSCHHIRRIGRDRDHYCQSDREGGERRRGDRGRVAIVRH